MIGMRKPTQLEDWLTKYTPIMHQSLCLAKQHMSQHTQDLRQYYASTAKLPVTSAIVKPQQI
jgi:hypothetical protein